MRTAFIAAAAAALSAPLASAHVDWRLTGCIGKVSNQGHLGTSDVRPSVEAVQCALAVSSGEHVELSTQQVQDCASDLGSFGEAFAYIKQKGLESAAAYPSSTDDVDRKQCIYEEDLVVAEVGDIGGSAAGDASEKDVENALQKAPVAAAFTVGTKFELYTDGILSDCGEGGSHAMEIVGYTDADPDHNNTAYWIVKNSWGDSWGLKGYVHIAKDVGACGLDKPTYLYPLNVTLVKHTKKYLK